MQARTIIKYGNIFQYILLCFIPRPVVFPLHQFLLEAAEETFNNRIDAPMSYCPQYRAF